jgi:hypothetical protein
MSSVQALSEAKIDIHRRLTPTKEPCEACREQMLKNRMAPPHARLMIMSSGPLGDIFGGGVETRYVCLDCGNIVIHSTGRLGQGWH